MQHETILRERDIPYELHCHAPAFTGQQLAQVEHVPGDMVAKPVIVKGRGGFAMCVLPAPRHLDMRRVAAVLEDSEVRLAMESEMAELFPDCELGAEPAIGSLYGLRTIIDRRLEDDDYVITAAGTHEESVKMRREDWERLCNALVANIACE
jgi:Ala-tRNA(Pro) deacylase